MTDFDDFMSSIDMDSDLDSLMAEITTAAPVGELPIVAETVAEPVKVVELTEIELLEQQLKAANEAATNASEQYGPAFEIQQQLDEELKAERAAYEAKVAAVKAAKFEAEAKAYELRKLFKTKAQEAEMIQTKLDQAKRNAQAQVEFLSMSQKWERLTAGAPWRKWG